MQDNMDDKSYKFLGAVSHEEGYKYSPNSYIKEKSKSNIVATWFFKWLFNGLLIDRYENILVYKASNCRKCGHLLTVPLSLTRDLGDCCYEASSLPFSS